jgi:hypothetical protein
MTELCQGDFQALHALVASVRRSKHEETRDRSGAHHGRRPPCITMPALPEPALRPIASGRLEV